MLKKEFKDEPKLFRDAEALEARRAELRDPHVAELTSFVEGLRQQKGPDYQIPYFDPWDGGIAAEVFYLFEAPGPQAKGSGFISRNNPDESAKNFFLFNEQARISRKEPSLGTWSHGTLGITIELGLQHQRI